MKRILSFVLLLALGLFASAWMGLEDGRASAGRQPARDQLNTAKIVPAIGGGDNDRMEKIDYRYEQAYTRQAIYRTTRSLVAMATPLTTPRSGEWRGQFHESEQNFSQYISDSRLARGALVVQPIGNLPEDQKQAVDHLLDAISAFFGMPAICAAPLALDKLPRYCFRNHNGALQINAESMMSAALRPWVGGDVASVIALTPLDIYPGERWPFESAYGWSSYQDGTAVLSTAHILDSSRPDRGRNLERLTKLIIHELCHTFSLKHCVKYNCLMNGCSDLRETDAKPLALCPDCLAKISLASRRDPATHLEDMLDLCKTKGFLPEARYYLRALHMLK